MLDVRDRSSGAEEVLQLQGDHGVRAPAVHRAVAELEGRRVVAPGVAKPAVVQEEA